MESMGQRFKAAREKKRMPLSQAAAQTRIKLQYLELMEQDDFTRMPAPAYAKGFIRMYATFLNLDPGPLVQEYLDQHVGKKAKPVAAGPAKPKANLPWLIKKTSPAPPAPAAAQPVEDPSAEEPDCPPVSAPVPAKPKRPPFPKPDIAAMVRSVAAWPWRTIGSVALGVVLVVGLVRGLARCARRADEPPALSRSVEFKRGIPAVLMEPPEPYLAVPAEPVEKAP